MTAALPACYPARVFDVTVSRVQDISATFRRITFTGPSLQRFGVPGPTLDLRIKLLLPVPGHTLSRPGAPDGTLYEGWYQDWLRMEQPARGFIRSYTVRTKRTSPSGTELDVDFVLHAHGGGSGPGSDWAAGAAPGQPALLIGPDATVPARLPSETGIRWAPQEARRVFLAGDETAVPAICSVLEALPAGISGHAFLEVPDAADIQDIATNSGIEVAWLPRTPVQAQRGDLLFDAVQHTLPAATEQTGTDPGTLYAWIGAEAGTVKTLRRYLVDRVGLNPKMSEFRGYWSLGKAGSGVNGTPVAGPELCSR
ncbi:siderophore-interacting protein [Arthrobacter sp. QXT-31]|uniref:siderophore-interacting protein n=1 Tax=Arthrobacter sp. QXT-31 TaxID=1357915 RepID=UPI00097189C1|nr:siderophore-interacting protein [Arthrobacter sp. QXT-31]APX01206.1 hypothetical protein BWQ92_05225 [Arthrobacter sp. QXT-31]